MMKEIIVDTSVFISYFRKSLPQRKQFEDLLDSAYIILTSPVQVELLSGCSKKNIEFLSEIILSLETYYPTTEDWRKVARWSKSLSMKGDRFGLADLLIVAIADSQKSPVWSLDSDFKRLSKHCSVKLFNP